MKSFLFSLLFIIGCLAAGAQCAAPVITTSGPTTICPSGSVTLSAPTGNTWTQKADLSGAGRNYATGFSIGSKGYIGTGFNFSTNYLKDFWEYDPATNAWTQKADFGGEAREGATGFSIGNRGYIGTGYNTVSNYNNYYNDFWEYDPSTNVWTRKANFGGGGRHHATGFSIGSKGYIGTGRAGSNYYKDFWEYEPSTNVWAQKSDFGGEAREGATGFSIGSKGYIGTGRGSSNIYKDFWEYEPSTNVWAQRADISGAARGYATGFSIGSKGYIGTGGSAKDFWEYNPLTNVWMQKADVGGTGRDGAIGFSIGSKGYIGTGGSGYKRDFWEYTPDLTYSWSPGGQTTAAITVSASGSYTVTATNAIGCNATSAATAVTVNTPVTPVITASGPTSFCPGGSVTLSANDAWLQKADLGVLKLYAVGFSIGSKGYLGTGLSSAGDFSKDFWEYDPATDVWTQKADFAGHNRSGAVGFSIGNLGYIGLGYGAYYKDFYEYNPTTNAWRRRADFAGTGRALAVGFSIGNKGYVGTGDDGNFTKDFWAYDPATDTWVQKANFGGVGRSGAVGFSIGGKGYIGTGYDGAPKNDFWEYDPTTDSWTQKTNFGGAPRFYAVAFTIGNKGYIGTGTLDINQTTATKDFWEYNPSTNAWAQKADVGGSTRKWATGFSIGIKGYIGTGVMNNAYTKDFWEYEPASYSWSPGGQTTSSITVNTAGSYTVTVTNALGCSATSTPTAVTVNTPVTPVITASGSTTFCTGGSVTLTATAASSYQWYNNGNIITGATQQSYTATAAGSYTVTTTNTAGCPATSAATTVTVNPAPAIPVITASGPTAFCTGGSVTLSAPAGSGYTYVWSPGGATTASVIATASGDYTVRVTNPAGCSATSSAIIVTVNTPPVATITPSGPTTICPGGSVTLSAPASNVWTQRDDLAGDARVSAVSFSIGGTGYLGTGSDIGSSYKRDFWAYDPLTRAWTQKADFGGTARYSAAGFSIGSKGYVGIGYDGSYRSDFWEYNPTTNTWVQKADFGGGNRSVAVGFSISSKGYIGTGVNGNTNYKDFWEYDPSLNTWTQKAAFAGVARYAATGFGIGSKGYVGLGYDGSYKKDFWEYNPATNAWTQKQDFAGTARYTAVGFSIGSNGYVGTGDDGARKKDFWQYSPATNTWIQKADFAGTARYVATGFSIGEKGFIGTGYDGGLKKDFWEFTPDLTYAWSPGGQTTSSVTTSASGSYTVTTTNAAGCSATSSPIVITASTPVTPVITASGSTTFCSGSSVTLTATAATTYQWYLNGNLITGATAQSYTASATGSYTVTTTNASGCSATSAPAIVTVNTPPAIPVITASGSTNLCSGNSVTLSAPSANSNTWTQKADFGGIARQGATGFSIGSKGYIGTGLDDGYKKDFWEYDPASNAWTQKADFGGTARFTATGFSIGSKGYIGTGLDGSRTKDFWEYDPASNVWTQKADFGGTARYFATGFNIGSKGYIGTGYDNVDLKKDFWEYDPASNAWTQKADFGGTARVLATGFSIGSKGYIGTGTEGFSPKKDFWEYDPASNVWAQKADFGGTARYYATGFNIGSKGYIGTGYDDAVYKKDFWEYDPAGNAWIQKADFDGTARARATGFSIGSKGYIGTGTDGSSLKDFWEFGAGYTYSWSPGGQTTSSITTNVSGNFSLTITNAVGCSATSAVIPVKAFPAGTVYVDGSKATSGDGASWATAYTSLQEALNAANLCSSITTIHVAKGTYKPVNNANRDSAFLITRGGLKIYGGYPSGGAGVRNAFANPTILSGDVGSSAIFDNSYHIMVIVGLSNTADSLVVDGFTITGGAATGAGSAIYNGIALDRNHGAAIDAEQNGSGKLAFRNLVIANNIGSDGWGAAMVLNTSGAVMENCIFYGNSTSGTGQGGALWNNNSTTIMNNCLFYNNYGAGLGGAIQVNGSNPLTVSNSTLYANRAGGNGGAIRSGAGSVLNINNSIFYKNDIGAQNGTYVAPGNDLTLVGTYTITNSMLQGAAAAYGNTVNSIFSADPLFVNADDPDGGDNIFGTADDGLQLQATSAAVNGGSNAAIPSGIITDITGAARIQNATVDMGAYESPYISYGIAASVAATNVCTGVPIPVTYTAAGTYAAGNTFTAQLSDAAGSFASPVSVGSVTATASSTLNVTIPAGTLAGTGYRIRVVSSNPAVSGTDNGSNIAINTPPSVTNPANATTCAGTAVSFTATASGSGILTYRWYKGTSALSNGATGTGSAISGATGATLTISNPGPADNAGNYNVQVSSSTGCTPATSAGASLTVSAAAITAPALTQPSCATPAGTIVVNATGSGTLEYSITNGANWQASPTFSGLNGGSYSIKVRLQANPGCITTYSGNPVLINEAPPAIYTVTASGGANGSISPSGATSVNCGANQIFTITPNAGFAVQNVVVDGVSVGALTSYTFSNVMAAHAISATFVSNVYTITAGAGANGTISPNGAVSVSGGASQTFTITPNSCYQVANVVVDGLSQGSIASYTFNNVTATHTISATFSQRTYTITASAGANAAITPAGVTNVSCGANQTYTITPGGGFTVQNVLVDNVSVGAVTSYTFNNVMANHTIRATVQAIAVITYYPRSTATDLSQVGQWTTDQEGIGGTSPQNFTSPYQLFNINGNGTTPGVVAGPWTLSGGSNAIITASMELSPSARLTVGTNSEFNFNAKPVTIRSSAAGTASIGQITGSLINATNVTVERYIPARRAWRILSAPVSGSQSITSAWREGAVNTSDNPVPGYGTFITGGSIADGFDQNPGATASIKAYSSTVNNWVALANTNATPVGGSAYMTFVYGNRNTNNISTGLTPTNTTLRAKGMLRTGDQTFPVSATGFTAIPNPYASPINFQTLTKTGVAGNFYLWDPKVGGLNGVGGYVTVSWNGTSYDVSSNAISPESQHIQSGQGFLVSATGGGATLIIKESDKVSAGSDNVFRTAGSGVSGDKTSSLPVFADPTQGQGLRVSLQAVNEDKAATWLDEVFASYKAGYSDKVDNLDALKAANVKENLGMMREGQALVIERRQLPTSGDTISLKLWNMEKKTYLLQVNPVNIGATGLSAYLEDKYLKTTVPLSLTEISQVSFTVTSDEASARADRFRIILSGKGKPVEAQEVLTKSSITAYPNPVVGTSLNLLFTNQPVGAYRVSLVNSAGAVVVNKMVQHGGGSAVHPLALTRQLASGIYQLQIAGKEIKTTISIFSN